MGSNQQILEKAIQIATDGGWDILDRSEANGFIVRLDAYGTPFVAWTDVEDHAEAFAQSYMEVIFDQEFAKALWGDNYTYWNGTSVSADPDIVPKIYINKQPSWQFHIQQMVIAKDHLQYLADNMPEGK